ncbi:hypothetical protein T458_06865 [Brevibacillus panacihumi W25]|uniref:Uncharacterized protein n=1 Tax=Brevibacillus panacihumi W25 TaxID=1408254 RepID=V6MJR2_9BACL|nr:hypothetical protein [Brevibacillus panacihumi]EST55678.1 hypothetical protein T458_06865 [Brevibacillus panacihumi W25]
MTQFPRIKLRLSDDFERKFGPERFPGYLIEPRIAAYLVDGEELAFLTVAPTDEPGLYIATSGHAYGGLTEDPEDIARVVDMLRNMSAWAFWERFFLRTGAAADFDFVWLLRDEP